MSVTPDALYIWKAGKHISLSPLKRHRYVWFVFNVGSGIKWPLIADIYLDVNTCIDAQGDVCVYNELVVCINTRV